MSNFLLLLFILLSENSTVAKDKDVTGKGNWKVGKWSECLSILERPFPLSTVHHSLVYKSVRTRRVRCEFSNGTITESRRCLSLIKPPIRQPCCSESWSLWTECDSRYLGRQKRVRYAPNTRSSCKEDVQIRVCSSETLPNPLALSSLTSSTSFQPHLYAGPWSPCQIEPSHFSPRTKRSASSAFSPTYPPRGGGGGRSQSSQKGRPELWLPKLPSDLEVSLIESKLPAPKKGFQKRIVSCRGKDGETLPLRVCVDGSSDIVVPTDARSCIVSTDCRVSEWTQWSTDEKNCERPRRVRSRSILLTPQGDRGAPCPHLKEYKEIYEEGTLLKRREEYSECRESYMLVSSSWSECVTSDQRGDPALCGGGLQTRNVSCLRRETQQPVEKGFCTHLTQIPRVQRCSTKCEEKCVVDRWEEWSLCSPIDCHSEGNQTVRGYQTRRRKVISGPDSLASCPHLEEIRSCTLESCYFWKTEPSPGFRERLYCHPSQGKDCGPGKIKYTYRCVDFKEEPANNDLCQNRKISLRDESCYVPCPEDCVWSDWSSWSPCPETCSGTRERLPISQRNRTLIAKGSSESPTCKNPLLSEIRVCSSSQCDLFNWRTDPWGPCRPTNVSSECGPGGRGREVFCSNRVGIRVPDWKCRRLQSPISWQSCEIPCPVNCQLTAWGEWSPCRKKCDRGSNGKGLPSPVTVIMDTQSRSRSVLQWPRNGGTECSTRTEIRPCPLLASSCASLRWTPDPWSNCTLPEGKMCGDGVRTRGLRCLKSGVEVNKRECFENINSPPIQAEECSVVCGNARASSSSPNSCVLGQWSPWSDCSVGCPSKRRRERRSRSFSNSERKRKFIKTDPCSKGNLLSNVEIEDCECMNYTTRAVGPWSECILEEEAEEGEDPKVSRTRVSSNKICGIGKRFQRLECYDENSFMADIKYCGGRHFIEKSCIVVCPMDCHMSPWSDWGLCDSNCGPGLKNRTSKILRLPTEGGRPCPGPTVEYSTCNYPCENFVWHAGPWSECLLNKGSDCGEGIRQRTSRCVQVADGKDAIQVPEKFCDAGLTPSDRESCHLYCPGECSFSEWSSWSDCYSSSSRRRKRNKKTSSGKGNKGCGRQRRSRILLRSGKSSCGEMTRETRPCPRCRDSYSWALTPWSSCRPLGDSGCGEGRQFRGIRCVRNGDGRSVKEELCKKPKKDMELTTWCSVDCPVDCEVAEWSEWDRSKCSCGPGPKNMTRKRVITTPGTTSGRPCPSKLIEYKPCPSIPCYNWNRTPWICDIQGASCGMGVARRNVSCVRSSYSSSSESYRRFSSRMPSDYKVSPEFCLKKDSKILLLESNLNQRVLDLHEKDVCSKSCPGDCALSEWTSWSNCLSVCIGIPTLGFRTRSRRILQPPKLPHGHCSVPLEDRQPCYAEACFSYSWKTMKNGRQECVRNDGKISRDGCHVGECDPICNAPYSECGPGLVCRCFPGYRPQYLPPPILSSQPPRLISCNKMENNETRTSSSQTLSSSDHRGTLGDDIVTDDEAINFKYFPDDSQLNYWMFAMIAIGCVFIAFVGVSIYIMCKSSNRQTRPRAAK